MAFHRFGHLALEPEQLLSNREIETKSKITKNPFPLVIDIWSLGPRQLQANRYLVKKWKMRILTMPSWVVNALFQAGAKISVLQLETPKLSIYGPNNALDHCESHLSFTNRESQRAQKELAQMGIDSNKPFVCLVVRDGGHYASTGESESIGYDLLNTDISTFELAAQGLAERGYQVVRMGAGSEKPMTLKHANVFDYAKSQNRSAFLDIYLAGKCSFAISTQTGPDCVSLVFRRPVCYIDIARYSQFFLGTNIAYWNPTTLMKNGSRMTLQQVMDSGVALLKDPDDFEKLGIISVRSTPEVIRQLAVEFAELYEAGFIQSEDDEKTANQANEIIGRGMGEFGQNKFGNITAHLNPAFLRQQGDWFLA
jgi:putative glycosyltransferase (TIGR04372 family)